jgi:hypothetical protein
MADHLLEEAFYNTQAARAAFYPKVSLQGIIGWTNNGGGSVTVNPGAMLLNAVLSLRNCYGRRYVHLLDRTPAAGGDFPCHGWLFPVQVPSLFHREYHHV